jgi:hypothetical protein
MLYLVDDSDVDDACVHVVGSGMLVLCMFLLPHALFHSVAWIAQMWFGILVSVRLF